MAKDKDGTTKNTDKNRMQCSTKLTRVKLTGTQANYFLQNAKQNFSNNTNGKQIYFNPRILVG